MMANYVKTECYLINTTSKHATLKGEQAKASPHQKSFSELLGEEGGRRRREEEGEGGRREGRRRVKKERRG